MDENHDERVRVLIIGERESWKDGDEARKDAKRYDWMTDFIWVLQYLICAFVWISAHESFVF